MTRASVSMQQGGQGMWGPWTFVAAVGMACLAGTACAAAAGGPGTTSKGDAVAEAPSDLEGAQDGAPPANDVAVDSDASSHAEVTAGPDDLAARADLPSAKDATPGLDATPPPPGDLRAFPGAEGFGALATGGRGGPVLRVTTLAAGGAGSLQEALDTPGPRTIVFAVSGVIDAVALVRHGDVTIAGQTSPGGITLRGLLLQGDVVCEGPSAPDCPLPTSSPTNFIVRHLRLRPADFNDPNGEGGGDGLRLHHAKLGILDHISIGNAQDEAVQLSFSSDVTIQYSHFAETTGEHYEFGGMLMNYSDPARGFPLSRLSIHHNVWNRIFGRMPEISRENVPDPGVMELELSQNLHWDPRRPIYLASANPQDDAPLHYAINLVGNYAGQNPAMAQSYGLLAVELGPDPSLPSFTGKTTLYFSQNGMNRAPSAADYELIYNANDYLDALGTGGLPYPKGSQPAQAQAQRHPFPLITYDGSGQALATSLAASAGAFPRDPFDKRLFGHVAAGTFDAAAIHTNPAGDALQTTFAPGAPPAAPADTDGDGMPDAWETGKGLDPAKSDGQGTQLSALGYTNLEVYLAERAAEVILSP